MPTIAQWLLQTTLPRNEARMLLQAVTQYSAAQLITHDTEKLPENTLEQLNDWARRRLAGEPMAYILGKREFYGRSFSVSPAVLIPRPETEHLVEAVLEKLPEKGKFWDLGTGSGIIAISVKLECPNVEVWASDISPAALAVAQQNAKQLNAQNIEWACGSWFNINRLNELCHQTQFDVIASNPPYIEANDKHLKQGDLRFEPQNALTDFADGLRDLQYLAKNAQPFLKSGAWLIMEHGYNQAQAVRQMLRDYGYQAVESRQDLAGWERLTMGQKPIGTN